ncbi:MAG: Lrp/AsnC family transcriptional regulator [Thermoplasmata archaeon]|nr:Lrp/AsnC family transcriptional regulator [Thermoplasmata archaeon]
METIFILAKVDASIVDSVIGSIRDVKGVKEVHAVTGSYDLFITMEGESVAKLLSKSIKDIGAIEGIQCTETLVSINLD